MDKNEIYEILNEAYFSDNPHEKEVIDHLPELLREARVFVDIGASLGQYAYHANKHMNGGQIFAIEADPVRYERLKSNCENWQTSSTNKLRAIHAAISDKDGKTKFYITNSNVSGGLFMHSLDHIDEKDKKRVEWREIFVDSFRLEALFNYIPGLIKIDVEGSELRVLRGCQNILRKGNPKIIIELHNWEDPEGQKNVSQVFDYMTSIGYESHNFYGKTLFTKHQHSFLSRLLLFFRRFKTVSNA